MYCKIIFPILFCSLKFRSLNTNYERIQNNKNENTMQQLPKPETVHLNKEKFSLLKNKSKIVPIKEVNLPLLQSMFDTNFVLIFIKF